MPTPCTESARAEADSLQVGIAQGDGVGGVRARRQVPIPLHLHRVSQRRRQQSASWKVGEGGRGWGRQQYAEEATAQQGWPEQRPGTLHVS